MIDPVILIVAFFLIGFGTFIFLQNKKMNEPEKFLYTHIDFPVTIEFTRREKNEYHTERKTIMLRMLYPVKNVDEFITAVKNNQIPDTNLKKTLMLMVSTVYRIKNLTDIDQPIFYREVQESEREIYQIAGTKPVFVNGHGRADVVRRIDQE